MTSTMFGGLKSTLLKRRWPIIILTILAILLTMSMQFIVSLRWEIALKWAVLIPRGYEITYCADTGPAFFGDGVFYYELYYEHGIKKSFLKDFYSEKDAQFEAKVIENLGYIHLNTNEGIDFNEEYYWRELTYIPNISGPKIVTRALYMVYQPDKKYLYLIRFKI